MSYCRMLIALSGRPMFGGPVTNPCVSSEEASKYYAIFAHAVMEHFLEVDLVKEHSTMLDQNPEKFRSMHLMGTLGSCQHRGGGIVHVCEIGDYSSSILPQLDG